MWQFLLPGRILKLTRGRVEASHRRVLETERTPRSADRTEGRAAEWSGRASCRGRQRTGRSQTDRKRWIKKQVSRSSPVRLWLGLHHVCGLCLLDDDPADVQEDRKVCLRVKSHTDDTKTGVSWMFTMITLFSFGDPGEEMKCAHKDREQDGSLDYPPQTALQVVPTPAHTRRSIITTWKYLSIDWYSDRRLTPHHQTVFSAGSRSQQSPTELLQHQRGKMKTSTGDDTWTRVNTGRTPADSGVDPEELPDVSEGEEQQRLQVQSLHQQPGEVEQNAPVEERHRGLTPELRSETNDTKWVFVQHNDHSNGRNKSAFLQQDTEDLVLMFLNKFIFNRVTVLQKSKFESCFGGSVCQCLVWLHTMIYIVKSWKN